MQSEKENQNQDDEKILEIARARFDLAAEAEREVRELALEDLKFGAGEQWDLRDKNQRELDRRPCLTINRLPQFIRQIVNDQRQNRPSVKVSPVDDKADIETAKILQGIIRHVENSSDADVAYDTAFDSAVRTGFGYFRIRTAYSDPMSFDLDIRIEPIKNRFSAYLDPSYKMPDGSDAEWGFIFDDVPHEEYKRLYPDSELSSMDSWDAIGQHRVGWIADDTVRIAEYFYKDYRDVTLLKMSDGSTVIKEDLEKTKVVTESIGEDGFPVLVESEETIFPPSADGQPLQVIGERKSKVPVVRWCKINAVEVLEKTDWPGRWIPIIPVLGEELDIEGKRVLEGIIRHAKDSQRMYNYWKSAETETIAMAPKAPWIVAEGQIEDYKQIWKTANVQSHAYLPYKPVSLNGQPVGPPQRNVFEPPIQAITQAGMMASEDMKATTGVYDAALGQRSNEQSGVAIQRRANQAQTSNFHFVDNLSRSIRHCGRQLVELIPKVMDTGRAVRILGEDGTEEIVRINEMFERNGKKTQFNLGVGKYDVSIETGPSYATKRQEAASSMLELAKSVPAMGTAAPDLIVKNLDLPGAQELAERLRKTLPPGLADDPKKQPLPPEAQAQMAQMNQIIEQLTAKHNEAMDKLENKTIELESRERIEMQKLQVQLQIEMAKIDATDSLALFKAEMAQLERRMNLLRQNEPIEDESQENQDFEMAEGPEMGAQPSDQPATGGLSPGQFVE